METTGPQTAASTVPPRVTPKSADRGDMPIMSGSRTTFGMKVKSQNDAFYFVTDPGSLRRYARRFPCTDEGWRAAWQTFATEEPKAGSAYLDRLAAAEEAAKAPKLDFPPPTAVPVRTTPAGIPDTAIPPGWVYILSSIAAGFFFGILAYVGADHGFIEFVAWMGLSLSWIIAMIGIIAEGVRIGTWSANN